MRSLKAKIGLALLMGVVAVSTSGCWDTLTLTQISTL